MDMNYKTENVSLYFIFIYNILTIYIIGLKMVCKTGMQQHGKCISEKIIYEEGTFLSYPLNIIIYFCFILVPPQIEVAEAVAVCREGFELINGQCNIIFITFYKKIPNIIYIRSWKEMQKRLQKS